MLSRNKIIEKLVTEGFSYKTLSLFSDRQIKELASRILKEQSNSTKQAEIDADTAKQEYLAKQSDYLEKAKEELESDLDEAEDIEDDEDYEKTHPKTKKIDTEAGELDLVLGEMDLDDRHPNREGSGKGKSKTDGGTFEPVNYDVTKPQPHNELSKKKELTHKGSNYIYEEFASKDQQKYFFAKCKTEGPKSKWCKMAKEFAADTKDFSALPEKVQSEMIEEWVTRLVENEGKTIKVTKSKLLEMVSKTHNLNYDTGIAKKEIIEFVSKRGDDLDYNKGMDLFDSMEQQIAFENLSKWTLDKDGYELNVDELEKGEDLEESVLLLYLNSPSGHVWDITIYTDGNIYMDDAPVSDMQDFEEEIREKETRQEGELAETERDTEGEYMGAPQTTTAPAPLKTPTIAPSRPGEKKRRGPFQKPKTTPKPKAKDKDVPEWFNFNKIKSQVENK